MLLLAGAAGRKRVPGRLWEPRRLPRKAGRMKPAKQGKTPEAPVRLLSSSLGQRSLGHASGSGLGRRPTAGELEARVTQHRMKPSPGHSGLTLCEA